LAARQLKKEKHFVFDNYSFANGNIMEYDYKKTEYKPPTEYLFLDKKRKLKLVGRIKKNIAKFDIKPQDVGFANA
jgi:hypothetical protein